VDTFDATHDEPLWGLVVTEPAGPADHVDELLSALLDIEDDIGQAVMWLAEHWTLDLPKVRWHIGNESHGRALRLLAIALDWADLRSAAGVLDAPITFHRVDDDGEVWLAATRRFGTVHLEVLHPVEDPAAGYLAAYMAKSEAGAS
jgi:hypothetical protein